MIIPILACDDEYRHICVNKSVNRGATLAADISNMQGGNVPKVKSFVVSCHCCLDCHFHHS